VLPWQDKLVHHEEKNVSLCAKENGAYLLVKTQKMRGGDKVAQKTTKTGGPKTIRRDPKPARKGSRPKLSPA